MCGGIHYGEIVGPVSVGGWSCSRGASCVVEYTKVEGLVSVWRWSCSRGASCVVEYTMGRLWDQSL